MCRRAAIFGILALGMGLASAALAQEEAVERFNQELEQLYVENQLRVNQDVPLEQRTYFDYGLYLTQYFAAIDDPTGRTTVFHQLETNLYARIRLEQAHHFFFRLRAAYRDMLDGPPLDEHGEDWIGPNLERASYTLDLGRAVMREIGEHPGFDLTVEGGRQYVVWGQGLVLSRALDGVMIRGGVDPFGFDLLAGLTIPSSTDLDSSRPEYRTDTSRGFFGGLARLRVAPEFEPYIYGLAQQDYNDRPRHRLLGIPTTYFYESHYIGLGANGRLGDHVKYGGEVVYQGGTGLSSPFVIQNGRAVAVPQTEQDIEALAAHARIDILPNDPNDTRFTAEVIFATGDRDRLTTTNTFGGNRTGTSDHAFNAFGLLDRGLAFGPEASNLAMLRLGASTRPFRGRNLLDRMQLGMDLHVFNKLQASAPIEEATSNDHFLGVEPNLYMNWQILSDVSLTARYGVFFPGTAIEGDTDPRHFFLTGLTLSF